jgi:Arc/MetJ-type ribon-helix-helix transcriptional regulator
MIRIQIQLPETEFEELRRVATRERRSMADCIREGIRWFLQRAKVQREDVLSEIAGKFKPRALDDLKEHDRWHVEAILSSKGKGRAK